MKHKAHLVIFSILALFVYVWGISAQSSQAPRLRPIQQDGKWGYIDQKGKVVIKPQFYWAEEFSEGLAAFENDEGLYGYIDETGRVVIEPKFERWSPFSEGLAAAAITNMNWGYIDRSGQWVIEPRFFYANSFRDGFAAVDLAVKKDGVILMGEEKSTVIDRTGKIIFEPVQYVLNARTSKGIAFFQNVHSSPIGGADAKNLLIDRTGKIIFDAEDIELEGFSEDVTPVKKGGKWGYVDVTAKFVIQPQFAEAKSFSEGLAAVKIGERWGYIDHSGRVVIPAKFGINEFEDSDSKFSEGLALVYQGDDAVFIDGKGSVILKPDFTKVEKFIGGLAAIKNEYEGESEKRGYIDKQGKLVWGPTEFRYKTNDDLRAQIKKREEREGTGEKLTPLTDEEKKLDYRNIIANQPDFTAEMSYFRSHYVSGSGFAYKLTRKGNRFRKESQFWTFVGETGKPRVRLNPDKTYSVEGVDTETGFSSDFDPRTLTADAGNIFTPLGKISIDGHECIKIDVKRRGASERKEELYLYVARDLQNLVIRAEMRDSNSTLVQMLRNINLGVSESAVQIPQGYIRRP